MNDELQRHLDSLARDDCYRVDALLKDGELERTERVSFIGMNGSEQGPYVRKFFDCESGLGGAYRRILDAQRAGERFLHLPRIIDCYCVGERDAVVMEFIPGRTLADEVYECDPSVELAARLFPQVCEAVRELHERFNPPLIHRDIKPSNFMVSGSSVFIIDLGIARTFDADASTDTSHFGTRAYAPPEQFGYGQTDVRSDVYALGMLLFYLLCEETPVIGQVEETLIAHHVPLSVRNVVLRAVSFDPEDRYQSVTELETAFESTMSASHRVSSSNGYRPSLPSEVSKQKAVGSRVTTSVIDEQTSNTSGVARKKFHAAMRLLSRTPRWLGAVWDIFLLLELVLWAVMCAVSVFNATGDTALLPIPARVVTFAFVWVMLLSMTIPVVDPRPVWRLLPESRKFRYRARLLFAGILFASATFGLILIGSLVLPYYQ